MRRKSMRTSLVSASNAFATASRVAQDTTVENVVDDVKAGIGQVTGRGDTGVAAPVKEKAMAKQVNCLRAGMQFSSHGSGCLL